MAWYGVNFLISAFSRSSFRTRTGVNGAAAAASSAFFFALSALLPAVDTAEAAGAGGLGSMVGRHTVPLSTPHPPTALMTQPRHTIRRGQNA